MGLHLLSTQDVLLRNIHHAADTSAALHTNMGAEVLFMALAVAAAQQFLQNSLERPIQEQGKRHFYGQLFFLNAYLISNVKYQK